MYRYAKCGNDCGRCMLYEGNLTEATRAHCAWGMGRYINWHPQPARLRPCAGCQAEEGYLYIRNCAVRQCARYNGVETCAACAAFPCQDVPTVSLPEGYRDRVAERLGEPVPEADYLAFIEPYEGMVHLATIRSGLDETEWVQPAPVLPLRSRMAAFPDELAVQDGGSTALRAVYELLAHILTGQATLYVRQIRLQQRRRELLNWLWVFGCFGEFQEAEFQLVIDGRLHGARKGFLPIVRKRDNTLHTTARLARELLWELGATIEHTPLTRKAWLLTMSLSATAGGAEALQALCRYVQGLVDAYGEPKYVGSSRYAGEAFERFSKADMSDVPGF